MGLTGKTETVPGVNPDQQGVRNDIGSFLQKYGIGAGLFPSVVPDAASMQPFQELFTMQNARNYAQAKESAGNLSGSGLGNIIGRRAGEANVEQGAFLSNLFEQRRARDQQTFLNALLGFSTAGVGAPQQMYQPGFLDYLTQGAAAAAPGVGAYLGQQGAKKA